MSVKVDVLTKNSDQTGDGTQILAGVDALEITNPSPESHAVADPRSPIANRRKQRKAVSSATIQPSP